MNKSPYRNVNIIRFDQDVQYNICFLKVYNDEIIARYIMSVVLRNKIIHDALFSSARISYV